MAICEVSNAEVLQRCEKCHSNNRIALDSLQVGVEHAGGVADARIVPLPSCPSCGSREFLIRSPDDQSEHLALSSFSHLHRLLVDHVHEQLVRRGRVASSLQKRTVDSLIAKTVGGKNLAQWFPSGLKVKLPEESRERAPEESKDGR